MSNSAITFDPVIQSQASKEVTINAMFDASSPASLYGRRQSTCSGLTWGYYGGAVRVNGVYTMVANGTVTVPASSTRYLEANPLTGAVALVTALTAGNIPLYTIVSGASTITSYTDHRAFALQAGYAGAAQAAVSGTPTVSELAVLTNALRDALVRSGIIKGAA